MAVFLGTHFPKLDEKGRIILPAKFREPLAEGLVLTKGQDHCLVVWPRARSSTPTPPTCGPAPRPTPGCAR